MSFLIETTTRQFGAVARRTAFTPAVASTVSRASFTTSVRLHKTVVESAKDTLKTVDRTVANKVADGLDVGVEAKDKVKQAVTGKAPEVKGQAAGKAEELKGQAKEVAGEAKGKAAELKGKAKGKVNEL